MLRGLRLLVRGSGWLSEWTGRIVSYLILVAVLVMVEGVISRYVFNSPRQYVFELMVFILLALFMLGGAYTFHHGGHVRMDALYGRLSLRKRAILDLITCWLVFFVLGIILWIGAEKAAYSFRIWETSSTVWGPALFPVRVIVPLGAFLILLEWLARFVRDLSIAIRGKDLE